MFQFYSPWFALFLPLPLFVRWLFKKKHDEEALELYFPAFLRLKEAFPKHTFLMEQKQRLPLILLMVSWILLVLALMQPEKQDQFIQENNHGYDLMLAVDISGSMQAVDFSTSSKTISRLDVTKEVVGKFVKKRKGDRVGLVTFGEYAYLHVPLTLDTMAVGEMLNHTVSGMAGNATAIGDAIGLSVKTLRERPEGSRVLVLLTDGEDNSSSIPPIEAAKLAKQYGIRIYTIGVGKNGVVPFPTQFGYQMAQVSIDETLLKEISRMTGGQYFQATDQKALEKIYETINQLEKTESNQSTFVIREPLFFYPLSLSMLFLLLTMSVELFRRRALYAN
jgi:Ca-activated chloride channel homolog